MHAFLVSLNLPFNFSIPFHCIIRMDIICFLSFALPLGGLFFQFEREYERV